LVIYPYHLKNAGSRFLCRYIDGTCNVCWRDFIAKKGSPCRLAAVAKIPPYGSTTCKSLCMSCCSAVYYQVAGALNWRIISNVNGSAGSIEGNIPGISISGSNSIRVYKRINAIV